MREASGRRGGVLAAAGLLLLALPSTLLAALVPRAGAAAGARPSLRLVAGFGQVAAPAGAWVPAVVELHGGGADVDGSLLVTTATAAARPRPDAGTAVPSGSGFDAATSGEVMTYELPVALGAGQDRTERVALQAVPGPLHAELRDGSGQVLASADTTLRTAATGHLLVAVVDDGGHRLGSLSGVYSVGTGRYAVDAVELAATALPDDAVLLRSFDEVLVDGAATGSLSAAQRQALTDYVTGGGGLALATGGAVRQVLEGIPTPLLPGSAGTVSAAPLAPAWSALTGVPAPPQAVETAALTPAAGAAVVLADARGAPLLLARAAGEGRVALAALDPGAGPLATWPGRSTLVAELLTSAVPGRLDDADAGFGPFGGGVAVTRGSVDTRARLARVLTSVPGIELPSAELVAALIAGYIVVAGPLSYLVLARVGRRDLLWASAPVLAVVCAVAAYATGLGTRGTTPVVTEVRVVELGGGGRALVDVAAAVYTPRGGSASLTLQDGAALSGFAALSGDGGDLVSRPGATAELRLIGAPAASIHGFSAARFSASPAGGVETKLRRTGTHLRGSLVNRLGTDLVDAVVIGSDGTRSPLGRLRSGASVSVDTSVATPLGVYTVVPGRCPGCLGAGANPGDRETLRAEQLSEAVQLRAQGDHPGSPVLVGVASGHLLPADLGGSARVDTLDAVVVPLAASGVDPAAPLLDPGRLLFSDAQDPGGQGVGPRTATYLSDGNSAVVDYRLPGRTAAGTLSVVGTDVTCFTCLNGAGTPPPDLRNGPQVVAYDYLDPATGSWRPLPLTRDSRGTLDASLDVAALRGMDLLLRIRVHNNVIQLSAPAVTSAGAAR